MAWALLVIRAFAGLTLAAHGAQKLLGWFGGPGYARTKQGFQTRGLRPGWLWAALAIVGEVGGGLSLGFGFLTSLGAAGAVGAMVMAISSHWKGGFFAQRGGFEYPLGLTAMSVAVGLAGPGVYSLDALLHSVMPAGVFVALAVTALAVDAVGIVMVRASAAASAHQPRAA